MLHGKQNSKIILLLLLTILYSCSNKIPNYFSNQYKSGIVEVVTPNYRQYTTSTRHSSTTHHMASLVFVADSCITNLYDTICTPGIVIEGEMEDYNYPSFRSGNHFVVRYNINNPHHFKVMRHLPLLDTSAQIDTTVGTITSIDANNSAFKFSYNRYTYTVYKFTQEACDGYIYDQYPEVIKGRKFKVIYEVDSPKQAIMLLDKPADLKTFHFNPHNNMIGVSCLPFYRASLIYTHPISKQFELGISATSYFDPLHIAKWVDKGNSHRLPYSNDYYTFGNSYSLSPVIKWNFWKTAPMGGYIKLQGTFLKTQNIKVNYINSNNFFNDSTTNYFLILDPSNKAITQSVNFTTWGLQSGIGINSFIDNKYRWMIDFCFGYQYYRLPHYLRNNINVAGTTYYYHDTPVWWNLYNIPVFMELNLYYKF